MPATGSRSRAAAHRPLYQVRFGVLAHRRSEVAADLGSLHLRVAAICQDSSLRVVQSNEENHESRRAAPGLSSRAGAHAVRIRRGGQVAVKPGDQLNWRSGCRLLVTCGLPRRRIWAPAMVSHRLASVAIAGPNRKDCDSVSCQPAKVRRSERSSGTDGDVLGAPHVRTFVPHVTDAFGTVVSVEVASCQGVRAAMACRQGWMVLGGMPMARTPVRWSSVR